MDDTADRTVEVTKADTNVSWTDQCPLRYDT